MRALRSSPAVDADLERRAERVAEAAKSTYAALGHDIEVVVSLSTGTDIENGKRGESARAAVYAGGYSLRLEEKYRVLGGSLDAARG